MYCSYIQVPAPIYANQTCAKAIQDNTSDTGTEVLFTEHILEFEIRLFGAKSPSLTASLKLEIFFQKWKSNPCHDKTMQFCDGDLFNQTAP